MCSTADTMALVRAALQRKILFLPHAVRQMSRPDRLIRACEVQQVVAAGEIIEDYPEDLRGHSCLILGRGSDGRPVHVVCAPKDEYLAIITAYVPDPSEWNDAFRVRRRS